MQQGEDDSLKRKKRFSLESSFSSHKRYKNLWNFLSYLTCPLEFLKFALRFFLRKTSPCLTCCLHFNFWTNLVFSPPWLKCFFFLVLPVTFNACLDQGESKRNKEAEDQPDVDHLGVRRWRELLYLAGEDGRHHQHDGQVHSEARLKVDWLEEGGGVGDDQQEQGGQVGG